MKPDDEKIAFGPAMGGTTRKLLKEFIGELKENAGKRQESHPPHVSLEYEDGLEQGGQRQNTDRKIRDLLENLKRKVAKYDGLHPSDNPLSKNSDTPSK